MTEPVELSEAHEALSREIARFQEQISGEYVDGWLLITHKMSADLEAAGLTAVGIVVKDGQSFALTRGMIEIARDGEVTPHRERPER